MSATCKVYVPEGAVVLCVGIHIKISPGCRCWFLTTTAALVNVPLFLSYCGTPASLSSYHNNCIMIPKLYSIASKSQKKKVQAVLNMTRSCIITRKHCGMQGDTSQWILAGSLAPSETCGVNSTLTPCTHKLMII